MAGTQPVAVYALRIPPGDIMVPAVPEFAAMFRLTMAAIDPSEDPELDASDDKQKPRATLKVVRVPEDMMDYDEDYEDEDEDESDSDDEEVNGGPSEKKAKAKAKGQPIDEDDEEMEEDESDDDDEDDEEDDAAAEALLAKIMKSDKKGKSKALQLKDDDSEGESAESLDMDECVLCTLDPEKQYQQPLDFVVAEGEKVFFKVSGSLTVHLTGNYVMPLDEPSDDDEDEYDLSPDEDELEGLDGLDALIDGDDESDELDDLEDPRVMEVDSDEEEAKKPKALPAAAKKGKNKRPADFDLEEDVSLDNIMAKSLKKEETTSAEPKKLSKAEQKKAKKLKNNEGEAATPPQSAKKDASQANGTDSGKKVSFAKNLEQGPTPSKSADTKPAEAKPATKKEDKKDEKKKSSPSLSVKDVQGVTVDERKIGSGPTAKKGSRLEMRYIGKLDDGKVFDSNKSDESIPDGGSGTETEHHDKFSFIDAHALNVEGNPCDALSHNVTVATQNATCPSVIQPISSKGNGRSRDKKKRKKTKKNTTETKNAKSQPDQPGSQQPKEIDESAKGGAIEADAGLDNKSDGMVNIKLEPKSEGSSSTLDSLPPALEHSKNQKHKNNRHVFTKPQCGKPWPSFT